MARLRDIVVDCAEPIVLARWWVQVLENYKISPYGPDDPAPEDDPTVLVIPEAEGAPRFWFTRVPEAKVVKNRVHVDLTADDPAAELQRLTGLGARILWDQENLTALADPEDNEFCLLKE